MILAVTVTINLYFLHNDMLLKYRMFASVSCRIREHAVDKTRIHNNLIVVSPEMRTLVLQR